MLTSASPSGFQGGFASQQPTQQQPTTRQQPYPQQQQVPQYQASQLQQLPGVVPVTRKVAMAAKSSALELFGGAPTTTVPATATVPTKQQPPTSGNLWQLVNGKAGVRSGGAGRASAEDFFDAPPVTHQQQQNQVQQHFSPVQQVQQ